MTGTACHGALELFVKAVYLDGIKEWTDLDALLAFYQIAYMDTFQSADLDTPEYFDGLDLIKTWHKRTEINDTVISCEVKSFFNVKTSAGVIPFNYIWDRCDKLDDTTYRVVDYKTIRASLSPEQLKAKIQPRAYALAAQIQFPQAKRIWVTFDMLRHDPVGIVFTREDNANFYRYLQRAAERIIATPEDQAPETLNPDCAWCIRKATCETLMASQAGGTVFSLTADEAAKKKLEVDSQIKALGYLSSSLDEILMKEAEANDLIEWETSEVKVLISASKRRALDSSAAIDIIGPELAKKYGKMNLGEIDKLLKSDDLTDAQKSKIRNLIYNKWGEPSAKVFPLNPIDEE